MVVKKAAVSTRVQKNRDKQLRESGGDAWFDIEKLVLDDNIYPRRNVLTSKVNQYTMQWSWDRYSQLLL